MNLNNYINACLTAIFQDNLGKPVPDGHHQQTSSKHFYRPDALPIAQPTVNNYYKLKGSVKELNKFHNYETEKITRNAAEYIRVVWFFHPRSSCTTHLMLFSERPPIHASCMTISGGRTKQTHNRFWRDGCSRLEYVDIRLVY